MRGGVLFLLLELSLVTIPLGCLGTVAAGVLCFLIRKDDRAAPWARRCNIGLALSLCALAGALFSFFPVWSHLDW